MPATGVVDATDVVAVFVASVTLFLLLWFLSVRLVAPGEGLVIYRLGRTDSALLRLRVAYRHGKTASARAVRFVIPLVDRPVRVRGDLLEAWDELRQAMPEGWRVARPREDHTRGVWTVRAERPGQPDIETMGHTEAEALRELARRAGA